jgi:uncharacterized protein
MSTFRGILIAPIRLYQRAISPALPSRCKYHPSCSEYAVHAVRRYGVLRGAVLAGWRLLRCNPFTHGGIDELADRRLFRGTPTRSERLSRPAHPAPAGANPPDLT